MSLYKMKQAAVGKSPTTCQLLCPLVMHPLLTSLMQLRSSLTLREGWLLGCRMREMRGLIPDRRAIPGERHFEGDQGDKLKGKSWRVLPRESSKGRGLSWQVQGSVAERLSRDRGKSI